MALQPSTEHWQLLKVIFHAAANLSDSQQGPYLDIACSGDFELRTSIEALLRSDRQQQRTSTKPADPLVRKFLEEPSRSHCRIGAYEILHEIGRGGMSTVYAAARVDEQFQKTVAIKILRPDWQLAEMIRRFQRERQLLASLEHPNIARLLDAGLTDNHLPYLVMEYVEGIPIDRYVEDNNLSLKDRIGLFRSVCAAVQYAHENLVVHRDLKPANILVNANGVPKLLDFGIAKLLRPSFSSEQGPALTLPNVQPLTPEYGSPEQLRGEPVTTGSDIYSLGVLLYLLITGKHPFAEQVSNPSCLIHSILEGEPAKPSDVVLHDENEPKAIRKQLRSQLRGDLDVIVLTTLRKEPQRRYRSVGHLSDDLDRYLCKRPVSARKDTALYRVDRFVRRHRTGSIAALVAIVALIATSGIAIHSASIAHEQRATAERRFQEGRQFARFVLFQLDEVMQSGITPTRKTMVERALQYLNGLEKDSAGDPSLQHELIEGYTKVGDLQGNLFAANVGDAAAAKRSYERALQIADKLVATSHPATQALRNRAILNVRLGNLLSQESKRLEALGRYTSAKTALEGILLADPQAARDLLDVLSKIGFTQLQMGKAHDALATYQKYLQLAETTERQSPGIPNMAFRRSVAFGFERVGYMEARTGIVSDGLQNIRKALFIYQELARVNPDDAAAQRDVAVTYMLTGDILSRRAPADAVDKYRNALKITERLADSDPLNKQYSRDRLVALGRISDALSRSGQLTESREFMDRAARLLAGVQPDNVADYDLMTYCSILLTKPVTDSKRARQALRFAAALVARTKETDPFALQLLAEARDAVGDSESAALTMQKALDSMPMDLVFDSRQQMQRELAIFHRRANDHSQQQAQRQDSQINARRFGNLSHN